MQYLYNIKMEQKILLKNIADNIRLLRAKHRISQELLAEKIQMSNQQISSIENELSEPKLSTIIRIAEVFNVTVNDLIYEQKGL